MYSIEQQLSDARLSIDVASTFIDTEKSKLLEFKLGVAEQIRGIIISTLADIPREAFGPIEVSYDEEGKKIMVIDEGIDLGRTYLSENNYVFLALYYKGELDVYLFFERPSLFRKPMIAIWENPETRERLQEIRPIPLYLFAEFGPSMVAKMKHTLDKYIRSLEEG